MITSRQGLVDYALRQLGAPVINIEVDGEQIEDAIDNAIQHYHEYHFDGITRDFLVHKITGTSIAVADASIFKVGDTVISNDDKTGAMIKAIAGNTLVINHQIGLEKFVINQTVKSSSSSSTTTIVSITLGDMDNCWIPAGDNIVGVTRILNISSILGSGDYMFNMQYQIMMSELQALTKSGVSMYYQTLSYLGHLDFIMKKERNFNFNRRMNRLYLEISWTQDIAWGDIVVAEIYRAVDENAFPEIYDDIWLKRYATALLKKQWGTNLSKYSGMQLPGGLTFNGQQIYNAAMVDIQKLEDEALYSASPLNFEIG